MTDKKKNNIEDIFNECDEIGKMLEESMGSERFHKALDNINKKGGN